MTKQANPATKGDLSAVRDELKADNAELRQEFTELRRDVQLFKQEMMRHFDVVIEDLRHDLIGARSDDVEVLKDSRKDHERRLRRLEKHSGLTAA